MRIYVKTGPSFKDPGCSNAQDFLVQVEWLLEVLQPKDFAQQTVGHSLMVEAQEFRIKTLSVRCLLMSKMRAYLIRFALRDYQDVLTLWQKYQFCIEESRHKLDQEDVEAFIEEIMKNSLEPVARKDWAKRVLLGPETKSNSATDRR